MSRFYHDLSPICYRAALLAAVLCILSYLTHLDKPDISAAYLLSLSTAIQLGAMETQTLINLLLGLVAFFGGIWVRGLSDSMKDLKKTDLDLIEKLQNIELLVAGQYVKREELKAFEDALFKKLDRIEAKIDNKQDK